MGDGSLADKIRGALDARKARSQAERLDYLGYATFQGHLLDWGMKMLITKAFSPLEFMSYQYILVWIAEEWGGVRTAYLCDLKCRQEMAKALERGETDLGPYLFGVTLLIARVEQEIF